MDKRTQVMIQLGAAELAALDSHAQRNGLSRAAMVRLMIRLYADNCDESYHDEQVQLAKGRVA